MFVNQAKKKGMFNNNINDRQSSPTDRCDSMNRDLIMRMNGYKQRDVKRTVSANSLTGSPLDGHGFHSAVHASYSSASDEGGIIEWVEGSFPIELFGTATPTPQELQSFSHAYEIRVAQSAVKWVRVHMSTNGHEGALPISLIGDDDFHFTDSDYQSIPFFIQQYDDNGLFVVDVYVSDLNTDSRSIFLFYKNESWTNTSLIAPSTVLGAESLTADVIASWDMTNVDGDGYAIDRSGNSVALVPLAEVGYDVPSFGSDTSTKMLYRGLTIDEGQYLQATLSPAFIMSDSQSVIPPMPEIPTAPTYSGTIRVVNWDGTGDYTTIQEAITAASAGDIVRVMEGEYLEKLTVNKDIKIVGVGNVIISNEGLGISYLNGGSYDNLIFDGKNTVVYGEWIQSDVGIKYFNNVTFKNYQNAFSESGGYVDAGTSYLTNCSFENNYRAINLRASGANITVRNSEFISNTRLIQNYPINGTYTAHMCDNTYTDNTNGLYLSHNATVYGNDMVLNGTSSLSGDSKVFANTLTADTITMSGTASLIADSVIATTVTVAETATFSPTIYTDLTAGTTKVLDGTHHHILAFNDKPTAQQIADIRAEWALTPTTEDSHQTYIFKATSFDGIDQYGKTEIALDSVGQLAIRWARIDYDGVGEQTVISIYDDADNYTSISYEGDVLKFNSCVAGTVTTETGTLSGTSHLSIIQWDADGKYLKHYNKGTTAPQELNSTDTLSGIIYIASLGGASSFAKMFMGRLLSTTRHMTAEELQIYTAHNLQQTFAYFPVESYRPMLVHSGGAMKRDDNFGHAIEYDGTPAEVYRDALIPMDEHISQVFVLFKPEPTDEQVLFEKKDDDGTVLKLDYTDGTFTASVTDTEGIKTATVSGLSERWMAMHVILEDTAILIYASDGKKSSLVGQALVGQRYKSATAPIIIGDMDGRIAELSIYGGYEPTIDGDSIVNNIHSMVGWK